MSASQIFYGHFGFDDAETARLALVDVVPMLGDYANAILPHIRHDDHVISVHLSGTMPSSFWHPCVGAIAELGGRATSGGVSALYDGDGTEMVILGAFTPAEPNALPRTAPCPWLPVDRPATPARTPDGAKPLTFDIVSRGPIRGLAMRDWLGLFCDLLPDGDRVWSIPDHEARDGAGLDQPRPNLRPWADLGRVPSARLIAYEHKELMSVVRVVGREDISVRGATMHGALRIDVEVHDVPMDERTLRTSPCTPRVTRLWLAEGAGLVAIETP